MTELSLGRFDAVVFTSALAAETWLAAAQECGFLTRLLEFDIAGRLLLAAIGPVTAAPMIAAGFTPAVPDRHRLASLIRTLSHRLSNFPDATAGAQARTCVFPIRRAGGPPE